MAEYPKVLVLGDGLLGSEVVKQSGWEYISHNQDKFDVTQDIHQVAVLIDDYDPDIVLNCIGYTNTYCEKRNLHWKVNYEFVVNLANFCDSRDMKLVHISTDYIYANSQGGCAETDVPVHQNTWYAYTKLISDAYIQLMNDFLLIRCSHKPKPFPYDNAFFNVKGTFDYVDVIASQIIELVKEDRNGIWNVGTATKSVYELAIQTKPDVRSMANTKLPSIEMDLTKFNNRK